MWGNGLLGVGLHPQNVIFHINCIGLWLINDRSSSWMSAKLRSLYNMCMKWRTSRRQLLSSPGSNGASAVPRPVSHFSPVKTFSPTYRDISDVMKAFALPGGNLSDFQQTSFTAACSGHYREMALVIVGKWRFILPNRIKTARRCQSKPEMPNNNCRRVSLTLAKIEFISLSYV